MANVNDLIENAEQLDSIQDVFGYIEDFFRRDRRCEYEFPEVAGEEDLAVIDVLFDDSLPLMKRIQKAKEMSLYSFETSYLVYKLSDEKTVFAYLSRVYEEKKDFEKLTVLQRNNYVLELSLFTDFLFSISNFTYALKVLKEYESCVDGISDEVLLRYAYIYASIEDGESLYGLYKRDGFRESVCFILLIVTLLKMGDEERAKDVYQNFMEVIPAARNIGNYQSLETSEDEQSQFLFDCLNNCAGFTSSLPFFFDWCLSNRGEEVFLA